MRSLHAARRATGLPEVPARPDGFEAAATRSRQRLHLLLRRRAAKTLHPRIRQTLHTGRAPATRQAQAERSRRQRRLECRGARSEEHTSELQSPCNLVCRLLLEKKKR